MTAYADDRTDEDRVYVDWPAAVAEEPGYPELAPMKVDLACDAMVYKPAFGDDF